MKFNKFALLAILGFLLLCACNKSETAENLGSLELAITDDVGRVVSGAAVKLYASQSDWSKGINQVGVTQFSDASGIARFQNLSAIKYYWFVEKDCKNNVNKSFTSASPLTPQVNNRGKVVLSSTGTLSFTNNSANPFRIYINGAAAFDMEGGTKITKPYKPIGAYSIRVLQLSGYVFFPTDQTYSGDLKCGETLRVIFP